MTSPHSYPPPPHQEPMDPPPEHPLHRFRRSSRDRKLAGVAGGIGRALGVDPVLIRVAFAVLTIFGGSGIGLYALGWLLLPGYRDQVSAAEALFGRGRSSVPAPMALLLCLVVLGSFTSMFTWGLHLMPIAIAAGVLFVVVGRRRGHGSWRHGRGAGSDRFGEQMAQFADRAGHWGDEIGRKAERWGDDMGRRADRWGDDFGRRAERWGTDFGHRVGGGRRAGCGRRSEPDDRPDQGTGGRTRGSSPFDRPAFWDDGRPEATGSAGPGAGEQPVDLTKDSAATPTSASAEPDPSTYFAAPGPGPRPSAPAWDPLGAAPFAWDLPEPGPVPPSAQELTRNRRAKALSRATFGLALIVGAVMALGLSLHWWNVSWAVISASALAVVAVGLFVSAIRGRRSNLIGIGILLSLATAFFTVTGIDGSSGGFGNHTWTPQTVQQIQEHGGTYSLAAGDAVLDLRNVKVRPGSTVRVETKLNMGDLEVILPADANVRATCTSNAGSVDCLGDRQQGLHNKSTPPAIVSSSTAGTFDLTAHVGAGDLTVHHG